MYITIIVIFSAFAFVEVFNKQETEKYKLVFAVICFSLLVFQDGFRWETGTDWDPYHYFFEQLTLSVNFDNSDFDIGYTALSYVIRVLTDEYSVFLIVHAVLFYSAFFYLIFKLSDYPFVSLLLFYMAVVDYMGMNRQFLAMVFYAVGLVYLTDNNKRMFILMLVIGALFHKSILICIFALFLNRKLNDIVLAAVLVVALLIAASGVVNKLPLGIFAIMGDQTSDKMDYYSTFHAETSVASMLMATVRRLIWIIPLMVFRKSIVNKPKSYDLMFNLYFIGTVFYTICSGTILQILTSRALIYFNIMEMFLVPMVLSLIKPNYGKLVVMFLLSCYVTFFVYKGFSNYGEGTDYFVPYKGIFINTDYVRQYTS